MTVTSDVTKTGDTVTGRFTIKNLPTLEDVKKPAYAFAGLADLAIEQVKEAPAAYAAEVKKVQARVADAPSVVKTLPAKVEVLYAELAVRGQRLVTSIRRQPATEAALAEGREAVKKVEAAATAAKKSAKASEKAVEGAAKKIG